ncbi:MBL fold metallo-hydrolase [Balneola sp. MJW-20]|uniref:MBL fold metallo-hydrolase n=1 Tax=Gracilimonas aurantiaca TaxID=3234185 RepID=UPI0034665726
MKLKIFEVGPFAENTYLLENEDASVLVDPGFANETEYNTFKNALENELIAVVLTHAHVDHILGLSRVLRDHDVPVYLSDKDYFLWENFESQSRMFGFNVAGFDFKPEILPADDIFEIGAFSFRCLYTPGHAPDHISLYLEEEELLLAGDALFKQSIGRTDLYKGDMDLLAKSIREKLYTLPDNTVVYPGHGPKTTIGDEKKTNPFVKA